MNNLPDFEAWAIFAKVAETGSFAGAAADLGISQPTVSKAITRLEQRMNTTLFHRTSRSMSLTESGLTSLERARRLLGEGEALEAEVTELSSTLRGPIRVAAPMSFGISHLAPALPAFMSLHPEVTLDLSFSDAQVELVGEGFDVALRISTLADSSLLARRLCAIRLHVVGSPAYFAEHGRPKHPKELAEHRALHYAYGSSAILWRFEHPEFGEVSQGVPTALRVNNAEALIPALRAGLGLALQPDFLAWQDVEAGILETVLEDWTVPPIALHLVTPPGRARPARVSAFMDYLAKHFAQVPWARPLDAASGV